MNMEPVGNQPQPSRPVQPLQRSNYLGQPMPGSVSPRPQAYPPAQPAATPVTPTPAAPTQPYAQPQPAAPPSPSAYGGTPAASPFTSQPVQPNPQPVSPAVPVDPASPLANGAASPIQPGPFAAARQPVQTVVRKPPLWKTQKFWLLTSIAVFVFLLLIGSLAWYRATHHPADATIPEVQAWPPVNSNTQIKKVGATAADQQANTARQQAIIDLQNALEGYYVAHGYYPTTAQMAKAGWPVSNLKNITIATLTDPSSSQSTLVAKPAAHRYAYAAGADIQMGACDNLSMNCNYYMLTATLSDGSLYTKTSLH